MARYRKVDSRIWNDEKFRAFTHAGQLAWFFLLTHPSMTALGAMRATIRGLATELRMSERAFRQAIEPAIRHSMLIINEDAGFVWLPHWLRFNPPEGPNSVRKAWVAALDFIPECPEKSRMITYCIKYLDGMSDAMRHAIGDDIIDAFSKSASVAMPSEMPSEMPSDMGCHIQEQEQLTGAGSLPSLSPPMAGTNHLSAQAREVLAFLNDRAGRRFRPVPGVLRLITARLASGATVENCKGVIARQVRAWKGDPRMAKYLRPETLFNATKFESYLGQREGGPDDDA